ncbi:long-chain-fatty-acid--CoA ligase [Candidatus Nitrospira bockiana]
MQRYWTQHDLQDVPTTCAYPDCTVPELLARSAARFPDSTALLFYGTRLTFAEFHHLARRFAVSLRRLGCRPGDRVAIMLPNIPQAVIGYYGALAAGAVVVQVNPLYLEREIETQLRDSGAETLLALDLFVPRIRAVQQCTGLKRLIVTSVRDFLPPVKRLLYPLKARINGRWVHVPRHPPVYDFVGLLEGMEGQAEAPPLPDGPKPDDLALLQYTGGTTGVPKGVMLSHRNVVANAVQCRTWMTGCREGEEVFLGVIPFFHVYGLSTCQHLAIMAGASLVLLPRFDVVEVLDAIHKHRVTVFSAIPMMFLKISEYAKVHRYDLRSLRVCLSGASPLHAEVQDRFERLTGVRITEGYGLTEAGPVTHCNPVHGKGPRGSIGVLFPDTEARIVDAETGERVVPIGEVGELTVRGPQIMQGYWNNEAETRSVIRNGWLYTGDLVRQDETGFFYLVDRKKDMIKTRGENVYPREVEEVLFRHPAVKDAVVVGVPDRHLGEAVKAYVVLHEGRTATEPELIAHCRVSLARFKVPSSIAFRRELPRTLVGKVLRRALQEEEAMMRPAEEGQTRKAG